MVSDVRVLEGAVTATRTAIPVSRPNLDALDCGAQSRSPRPGVISELGIDVRQDVGAAVAVQ